MLKIVTEVQLTENVARKKVESYRGIARNPRAMFSKKTNTWYVCLAEVEQGKVEQARFYFRSKGITTWVLVDE